MPSGTDGARSPSPTKQSVSLVGWDGRQSAQQRLAEMSKLGLHPFDPSWSIYHSGTFKECTMKIPGREDSLTIPVQTCTKVSDVRSALAARCLVPPESLSFVVKQGCSWRKQLEGEEIARRVTVRGLKTFEAQSHKWPHTVAIIGAGYNGIKNALLYAHDGGHDFVVFDRYDKVGGHAWLTQANKTSKLQTDMAAFHVWFGYQWGENAGKENDRLTYPREWSTWPLKDEVIAHIQHACERYGLIPHCRLSTDVVDMDIMGRLTDLDRHYALTLKPVNAKTVEFLQASIVYHFPGAYFLPRIITYPGEDTFGGQMGFGMHDDMPYGHLKGSRTAILGNGAFAVENVRTCMEYGADKVYLITRRKNLPSPRLPCWFVHQAIFPVPAAMLLSMFPPMFDVTGDSPEPFGDPWEYHSVYGSADRKNCTIKSASRFGIGDVTFLAVAWGRCEYIVDTLKRCSEGTLHLNGGQKLDNINNLVKALGLLADFKADQMHKVKEMNAFWPSGDFRRCVFVDPLGMHASNFSSFSTGVGSWAFSMCFKHFVDFPSECDAFPDIRTGFPNSVANENKPAIQYDAKYSTQCMMMVETRLPKLAKKFLPVSDYFHKCVLEAHPLDKFFAECTKSWDDYQAEWKAMGFKHEYIPYPYTMDHIKQWREDYERVAGPLSLDKKEEWLAQRGAQNNPGWSPEESQASQEWWATNCQDLKQQGFSAGRVQRDIRFALQPDHR